MLALTINLQTKRAKIMITFTKSFKTSDGKVHATIDDAQQHELSCVFKDKYNATSAAEYTISQVVAMLVSHRERIVDILTTTANSKPKARSVNGGRKNRKTVITDAVVSIGATANTPTTTKTLIANVQ